uniref:Gamma-glutamyltranspeptidase n=1 Tax=Panagrolaimus sp. JU765 TaxID=591449 RepID=A0AC34R633_9BILA
LIMTKLTNETYIQEVADKIKASTKTQEPGEYGRQNDQPGKHGTSHVSVVDADGNTVSITSTINNRFGSRRRSESLGIIWNDEMDDFSIPGAKNFYGFEPAKANFMAPGKRPMSSMSPVIIYDKSSGDVKASVGASGGSKIISALAQFMLFNVNFNATVKEAIDFPRIHNQFTPINT